MDNEFCPICGDPLKKEGKFVNRLTDGTVVCERCAAKTRFLYPVKSGARIESERKFHRTGKLSGSLNTEYYEYRTLINPVEEMTLDEFRRALDETDQKRSAEIAEYRQYKCVILVESCFKLIRTKKDLSGEEKYQKEMPYRITGRVLYGELHNGDTLHVRRKEREELITVTHLMNAPDNSLCLDAETVYEGSYANFSVAEEAFFVYRADILFSV